jgi:hypothetical protein
MSVKVDTHKYWLWKRCEFVPHPSITLIQWHPQPAQLIQETKFWPLFLWENAWELHFLVDSTLL